VVHLRRSVSAIALILAGSSLSACGGSGHAAITTEQSRSFIAIPLSVNTIEHTFIKDGFVITPMSRSKDLLELAVNSRAVPLAAVAFIFHYTLAANHYVGLGLNSQKGSIQLQAKNIVLFISAGVSKQLEHLLRQDILKLRRM
jgi:hypothetical protein